MPNEKRPAIPYIITLAGEFDIYTANKLAEMLAPAYEHPDVIIDLSDVRYLDSTALTALVRMHKRRVISNSGPCRLVGLNTNLQRLFQLTRLDLVWPICQTLDEALASFETAANAPQQVVQTASDTSAPR